MTATDEEALAAFHRLAETEGIIPALEPAHALARALDLDAELVLVGLSGRGDKDLAEVLASTEKTLVVYLMAGPETPELAAAAEAGGADVLEIGFPFSDPLADGPVIRRAAERALARACARGSASTVCATFASAVGVPLVPMTYSSLLEAYGWERFDARCAGCRRESLIVADLPVDEHPSSPRAARRADLDRRADRARGGETDGWLYLVTVAGTTGARAELSPALAPLVERTRRADGRAAVCGLRHLDARAGRRRGRARRRRRGRLGGAARGRGRPGGARGLRRSATRRARVASSQSLATCQASEPGSMCSKWPVSG